MELPPDDCGPQIFSNLDLVSLTHKAVPDLKTPTRKRMESVSEGLSAEKALKCCAKMCVHHFRASSQRVKSMEEIRSKMADLNQEETNAFILGILGKLSKKENVGDSLSLEWALCGATLCRNGFCILLGINEKRVMRLLDGLALNLVPPDKRKHNGRAPSKGNNVDSFFTYYYWNFAETLAEAPPEEELQGAAMCTSGLFLPSEASSELPASFMEGSAHYSEAALAEVNAPAKMVRLTPSDGSTSLAPRYINHMTMEAFYQIYLMWANGAALDESEIAGCWCFRKTYDTQWKSTLRMRTVSQHARCSTCAEFSARCNKAACESDRLKLEAVQKGHLLNVHQYRLIQGRLNTLSETEGSNILKIDLDGLDQNKTKFPRNLASSKTLSSCWRPQLHLVGVIVWGVVEGYVILPPDVAKDSSCEATLVMKAVDWAHEELSRHGRSLPEHLVIETDNCVREGKNQIMAKLSASAIITNRFRSVTHIFGQVGHTHGPIDQRLGQAAATFSKQACIESPEDFVDLLKNQFSPIRNRTLKVELLPGSLDMKKYLSQYTVEIGGLVTSHHDPADANHCWRFIRRSDLPVYDDQTGESWAPQEIPKESYPHLPNDCILLVKHLVNSESLSQSPMTLLPASFQDKVKVGVQALPRNLIADRARKEFRRTADVVERDPWLLHKAAKALREWVDNNEKQEWPEIPEPKWWFSTDVRELGVEPTPNGWEKFAPGPVRQVTITPGAAIGGEPKRRGRPPKRKDAEVEKVVPLGEGEQVFGPRSKKRSTVVPPTEEIVPKDLFGAAADLPADPPAPEMPWPTRATFAGRKKPTNEEAGAIFEARRSKFYEMVPSQYWRDGLERDYWNKCVQGGCVDLAVEEFLKDHGAAASNQGAGRGRGRGRGKQAKAKAMPKEPGRNRGRGRSKALGKR